MSHLIAFVFCIAILLLAGGWVKTGMMIMAVVFAMLVVFVGHLMIRIFLSSPPLQ